MDDLGEEIAEHPSSLSLHTAPSIPALEHPNELSSAAMQDPYLYNRSVDRDLDAIYPDSLTAVIARTKPHIRLYS